jgi:hypothetical protein
MFNARAVVNHAVASTAGITFALVGGKLIPSVPVLDTVVNEKISDVTGINKSDLRTAELTAVILAGATKTGQMTTDQAAKCARAAAEGLTAVVILDKLRNVEAIDKVLPKKGTWADFALITLAASLIHKTVNAAQKTATTK